MKIAYVSSSYIPSSTANSVHVIRMCDAFVDNGHQALLLGRRPSTKGPSTPKEIRSYYGTRNIFPIQYYYHEGQNKSRLGNLGNTTLNFVSIANRLFQFRPDIVYGRDVYGCHVAATLGYQTILESHKPLNPSSKIESLILERLTTSRRLKHLVTISIPLAKLISMSCHRVDLSSILVAHDAADPVPDMQLPEDWCGRPGRVHVGYCGSFYPGRGIGLMLELAHHFPNMDFHFVGGSKDEARDYCDVISENTFFYGFVPPSKVYRYRNACDILMAPYERKVTVSGGKGDTSNYMSPLKVFEYMSGGNAIIVSEIPVLHEVLTPGRNCIMAEPESLKAWVNALIQLEDEGLRNHLGNNAKKDFLANHTWTKRAELVLQDPF